MNQSGVPDLRADHAGKGGKAVAPGGQLMLTVQFAQAFLLAESVELGGDHRGSALVDGPGELKRRTSEWWSPPRARGTRPPAASRVGRERERVFGHLDTESPGLSAAALEALLE